MIWLGGAVSPQIIDDLYGVESVEELDIRMVSSRRCPLAKLTRSLGCQDCLHCSRRKSETSSHIWKGLWGTVYQ